jgi:hypothetical protein
MRYLLVVAMVLGLAGARSSPRVTVPPLPCVSTLTGR